MRKKGFIILIAILTITGSLNAGWSYRVHLNYLKESASILDYFDYQMCVSYKEDLKKGLIEGEIQYKYRENGKIPKWIGQLSDKEINYLQGHVIELNDVNSASDFFFNRITSIKDDIVEMRRPYSEVMFELGYILHSINNILLPIYEGVNYPEQPLAAKTGNLHLTKLDIEEISDFKIWLKKMIVDKVNMRIEWSEFANNKDREGFIKYADEANIKNIYTLSSILQWVISDCFGPGNLEIREKLETMKEGRMKKVDGRKKWN